MSLIAKNNGVRRRFIAMVADNIILVVLTLPLVAINILISRANGAEATITILVSFIRQLADFVIFLAYFGWFYKNKGATPGKLLMKLQVVNTQTGGRVGYGKTFLRELVGKFLSAVLLCAGFIMILFRKDKRGLHDFIANTHVVYTGEDLEKSL